MSKNPAAPRNKSAGTMLLARPKKIIATPHRTAAIVTIRPWRLTFFAQPDVRLATKAPAAIAAGKNPTYWGPYITANAGYKAWGIAKNIAAISIKYVPTNSCRLKAYFHA